MELVSLVRSLLPWCKKSDGAEEEEEDKNGWTGDVFWNKINRIYHWVGVIGGQRTVLRLTSPFGNWPMKVSFTEQRTHNWLSR